MIECFIFNTMTIVCCQALALFAASLVLFKEQSAILYITMCRNNIFFLKGTVAWEGFLALSNLFRIEIEEKKFLGRSFISEICSILVFSRYVESNFWVIKVVLPLRLSVPLKTNTLTQVVKVALLSRNPSNIYCVGTSKNRRFIIGDLKKRYLRWYETQSEVSTARWAYLAVWILVRSSNCRENYQAVDSHIKDCNPVPNCTLYVAYIYANEMKE
jgi:hypothetical protein